MLLILPVRFKSWSGNHAWKSTLRSRCTRGTLPTGRPRCLRLALRLGAWLAGMVTHWPVQGRRAVAPTRGLRTCASRENRPVSRLTAYMCTKAVLLLLPCCTLNQSRNQKWPCCKFPPITDTCLLYSFFCPPHPQERTKQ